MAKSKARVEKEEFEKLSPLEKREIEAGIKASKSTKIEIKCKSPAQKQVLETIEKNYISIITGPPGAGKTYLSCARALKYIKDPLEPYTKIVLIKSVNVPKDEEIGYLKGTLEEKMEMYMYPFIANFNKIIGKHATEELKSTGVIEILPIKFALGVTLDNSIVIIDEAQQIAKDHLRTLSTRIGTDSKIIFLGDIKQKSVNKNKKSALEILTEHFSGHEGIGAACLGIEDIVRHPIIKTLEEIFDKIEKSENLNGGNT